MQKFVIKRNKGDCDTKQNNEGSTLRLCGYLRKKRTKLGGWSKYWYVLQDQLLLSFTSRESYEKKLMPFKDVISLVPGTIIKPVGGTRFTIETTTNVIYTFRCDDIKQCSQWITGLMESLSNQTKGINGLQKPYHCSLDNLSRCRRKSSMQASQSWESVYQRRRSKSPNIPIMNSTARILERNGIKKDPNQHREKKILSRKKVRNFRLHHNMSLSQTQSYDVSRINSMFNNQRNAGRMSTPSEIFSQTNLESQISTKGDERSMEEQIANITLYEENSNYSYIEDLSESSMNSTNVQMNFDKENDKESSDTTEPVKSNRDLKTVSSTSNLEPIYAVVDLKHKHEYRAKMRDLEEAKRKLIESQREKPHESIPSKDYEDIFSFHPINKPDDTENIYEPINIPEDNIHRNNLWQIPKFNLDALNEFRRNRKENNKEPVNGSSFSDFRRRLEGHRKSIKKRMKNFYNKGGNESNNHVPQNSISSDDDFTPTSVTSSSGSSGSSSSRSSINNHQFQEATTKNSNKSKSANSLLSRFNKYRKIRPALFTDHESEKGSTKQ